MGKSRALEIIHENVNHTGDDCLIWPMGRDDKGYGFLNFEGKSPKAHRLMLILAKGEPPTPKHQASHTCGNGHLGCFNPRHLVWKTNSENQRDRRKHGRHKGAIGRYSRLTPQQIKFIQDNRGVIPIRKLAVMHGVKRGCIDHWHKKARAGDFTVSIRKANRPQ